MLAMARKYVAEGLSVIPLRANGKEADGTVLPQKEVEGKLVFVTDSKQETFEDTGRPKTTWTPYQTRRATDEELVKWFADGQRNIGIVTGAISGFVVADADGPIGVESAKKLQLNSPRITKTTREEGGWHLWFKHPGVRVGNIQESSMHKKLDVRGDGGYVVAPPSQVDGKRYKWIIKPGEVPVFNPSIFSYNVPAQANPKGWVTEAITSLESGNRHTTLVKIVGKLIHEGLSESETLALLMPHLEAMREEGTDEDPVVHARKIIAWASAKEKQNTPAQTVKTSWNMMTTAGLIDSAPPVDWLIPGWIPRKSITWLFGNQGWGKSWVTMDLAIRLSEHNAVWLNGSVLPQARVLYLDDESSHALLADRIRQLAKGRSLDSTNVRWVVKEGWDILNKADCEIMARAMEEHKPEVVVMDSYSCFHTGDDNSTDFTMRAMSALKNIVHKYNISLIMVDHMSSGAASRLAFDKNNDGSVVSNDVAGSKVKMRQADSAIALVKKDGRLELKHVKARFGQEQAPVAYSLVMSDGAARLVPETLMSDATEF